MADEGDLESQKNLSEEGEEGSDSDASTPRAESGQSSLNPEVPLLNDSKKAFLTWRNLKVSVTATNRKILHGLSGCAEPGRLLAIMGPSGSGKSTLLDTLAGRPAKNTTVSGQILVNGHKAELTFGGAAYLAQDVHLLGTLTVYETLYYSARLRFSDSITLEETKTKVIAAIAQVGLADAVNTPIGSWYIRGVSGGEKRRVSIAVALLTDPYLLFLDEPTSGLDSAAAFHVVQTLKHLSRDRGRTILCSIHQPSSEVFELFDILCLLSDGRQVFFGPLPQVLQFFSRNGLPCPHHRSPSDHYLHCVNSDFDQVKKSLVLSSSRKASKRGSSISDKLRGNSGSYGPEAKTSRQPFVQLTVAESLERLTQAYAESDEKKSLDDRIESILHMDNPKLRDKGSYASVWRQSYYLTKRSFINMHRDIGYFWLRLVIYIVLTLCIGTVFNNLNHSNSSIQDRFACMDFLVGFMGTMVVAGFPSFIEDMKNYEAERMNGHYRVIAFAIGNSLSSAPFILLITLVATGITYPLIKFRSGFVHVLYFTMALFGCLLTSEALMMIITSILSNFLLSMVLGVGTTGLYLLVSGFFRLPDDMPKVIWRYPLFYVGYTAYGFEGVMQNEFLGQTFESYAPGHPRVTGSYILKELYDIEDRSKWLNLGILFSMVLAYRVVFYLCLECREKVFPVIGARIYKMITRCIQSGERTAPTKSSQSPTRKMSESQERGETGVSSVDIVTLEQ